MGAEPGLDFLRRCVTSGDREREILHRSVETHLDAISLEQLPRGVNAGSFVPVVEKVTLNDPHKERCGGSERTPGRPVAKERARETLKKEVEASRHTNIVRWHPETAERSAHLPIDLTELVRAWESYFDASDFQSGPCRLRLSLNSLVWVAA